MEIDDPWPLHLTMAAAARVALTGPRDVVYAIEGILALLRARQPSADTQ
jgi:hypothetical protein